MKEPEIIEGNKLIAEFMGGKYSPVERHSKVAGNTNYEEWHSCETEEVNGEMSHWGFKYHSSWDWLMPVVDKIESLFFNVVIEAHITLKNKPQCYIYNPAERFEMKPIQRDKKIDAVHEAVIEFIKWHNQQSK